MARSTIKAIRYIILETPAVPDGQLRFHDGSTWIDLPIPTFPDEILAGSPKDIWLGSGFGEPMHYDGTQWSGLGDFCGQPLVAPSGRHYRRAPDGKVWLVGNQKAIRFDLENQTCKEYLPASEELETFQLSDIAWSATTGEPLAMSIYGQVYRIEGDRFAPHEALFADPAAMLRVQHVYPLSNGDFLLAITRKDQLYTSSHFVKLQMSGGTPTLGTEYCAGRRRVRVAGRCDAHASGDLRRRPAILTRPRLRPRSRSRFRVLSVQPVERRDPQRRERTQRSKTDRVAPAFDHDAE